MKTIIDAKIIGICSKHRKDDDEIPKYKDGSIIDDKDICCIFEVLGNTKKEQEKDEKEKR
jgi:hypothetical protein